MHPKNENPARAGKSGRKATAAFTLLEAVFGLTMIAIAASATLWALANMNAIAAESRLYTGAMTVAQNQIDLILSDEPYNPQKNQIPPELSTANTASTPYTQTNVPIYTDPVTGSVVVAGTVTTVINALNQTMVSGTGGNAQTWSLNTVSAVVTVTYQYRNRTYSVSMWTLRTSDV